METTTKRPVWDRDKVAGALSAVVGRRLNVLFNDEPKHIKLPEGINWDLRQNAPAESFTLPIIVSLGQDTSEHISIVGFSPDEHDLCTQKEPRPELVELRASQYSGGGLQTESEWLAVLYGLIYAELRKMGFHVVGSCEDYF